MQALGFVETRSLVAALKAADAMSKAADVRIADFNRVGSGIIAVIVEGEVAAVTSAVDHGKAEAEKIAEIISWKVLARPHEEVANLMEQEE